MNRRDVLALSSVICVPMGDWDRDKPCPRSELTVEQVDAWAAQAASTNNSEDQSQVLASGLAIAMLASNS